ncbi:uncharacterized protein LOC106713486 [Papilio machaon]|uniref:uncharacterized protein LOC106713486 n=1 Tax=Papilio machaon TaxID=76193 RepID=UPI001E6659AD|nr:uncharacterized protein LOC106713486 [Papilio machaon]
MPAREAPCMELGSAPRTPSIIASPSPSEISSASSPEPPNVRTTPLFRALAMPPPEPEQPRGQDELERRLPGYRRIVIPRELTLIELLKECSGVTTDEEVLRIREAKLRVVAERVGLRRLHVLVPRLRSLTLDGSAILSLRELGIGLDHLKILSVNRCGLTSLDGVWGVGQLRELHAAGNRIRDLHPLAVLQKLHTLNLSNNPITVASRVWTLGVCSSLRRLFLNGTPFSQSTDYRSTIASTLSMLTSLDDQPLHTDVNNEDYVEHLGNSSDSESDREHSEEQKETETDFAIAGTSSQSQINKESQEEWMSTSFGEIPRSCIQRRRPATTENAGCRPERVELPRRPRTAVDRPTIDAPTRLQIMNTLMDAEWRSCGSKMTSKGAVCGNLANALRRPAHSIQEESERQIETVERTMEDACRFVAAEIPRAPCQEAWLKFTEETGIEIDINFNERPQSVDPSKALDRLERIERETSERLKEASKNNNPWISDAFKMLSTSNALYWRETEQFSSISNTHSDVDSVISDNGGNPLD